MKELIEKIYAIYKEQDIAFEGMRERYGWDYCDNHSGEVKKIIEKYHKSIRDVFSLTKWNDVIESYQIERVIYCGYCNKIKVEDVEKALALLGFKGV